jgi:hypothetical protein
MGWGFLGPSAAAHYQYPHKLVVIIVDNNSAHLKYPTSGVIAPGLINQASLRRGVEPMPLTGDRGLRQILEELERWTPGMSVTKAREMLWRWSVVVDQLTAVEAEIWKDDLQLLIHNVAYHPEYNRWRSCGDIAKHYSRPSDSTTSSRYVGRCRVSLGCFPTNRDDYRRKHCDVLIVGMGLRRPVRSSRGGSSERYQRRSCRSGSR